MFDSFLLRICGLQSKLARKGLQWLAALFPTRILNLRHNRSKTLTVRLGSRLMQLAAVVLELAPHCDVAFSESVRICRLADEAWPAVPLLQD